MLNSAMSVKACQPTADRTFTSQRTSAVSSGVMCMEHETHQPFTDRKYRYKSIATQNPQEGRAPKPILIIWCKRVLTSFIALFQSSLFASSFIRLRWNTASRVLVALDIVHDSATYGIPLYEMLRWWGYLTSRGNRTSEPHISTTFSSPSSRTC